MHLKRSYAGVLAVFVLLSSLCAHAKKSKDHSEASLVDSGTFGIFKAGRRIATETFKIKQTPAASITASEINRNVSCPRKPATVASTLTTSNATRIPH